MYLYMKKKERILHRSPTNVVLKCVEIHSTILM